MDMAARSAGQMITRARILHWTLLLPHLSYIPGEIIRHNRAPEKSNELALYHKHFVQLYINNSSFANLSLPFGISEKQAAPSMDC